MKNTTLRLFCACVLLVMLHLLLAGCRTSATAPTRDYSRNEGAPLTPAGRHIDSVVVQPHRSLVDKLTGRTSPPTSFSYREGAPARIGKKSTVSVYYGPATVTTIGKKATAAVGEDATTVAPGKKAGPVVLADSGAKVQLAVAKDQAAAGEGIEQQHTETKKTLAATLLPWVAGLGGVALAWWLLLGGGGALLLAWWRRNKSSDTSNQA